MKNLRLLTLIILTAAAAVSSAHAEIIDRVYAIVGEKIITQYELESLNPRRLQYIYKHFTGDKRTNMLHEYYSKALDLLVDNYIIEQAAAEEGVRVSNKEVSDAIKEIMVKNNVDEEKLSELLAASNLTLEQYKWKIKIDILKARLMNTVFKPKIIITEKDIKDYIDKHADSLDLSDMYELRILKVDNKAQLDTAMADLKKGDSFRDMVMKFSKANNAGEGGYLGWVEFSFLEPSIRKAVEGIHHGITKPIKGDDGSYRVLYVENYKNKELVSGDKKLEIVKEMQQEQSQVIFDNWLAEKKKEILIQKMYEG
jgi:peptidyl-prolyl cis-trans isomerase SurA